MATIKRFGNCKIAIYPDDHPPPHVHIDGPEVEAMVRLDPFGVVEGDAGKVREALEWARENAAFLLEEWHRYNRLKR